MSVPSTPETRRSKVLVSTVSTVLGGLILLGIREFVPSLWGWLSDVVSALWTHFKGTSGLPNWGLYVLVTMSAAFLIQVVARMIKPKGPRVTEYNHDTFFGLIWRWSYMVGSNPVNIWAYCPKCDTALVYSCEYYGGDIYTILTCETCNEPMYTDKGKKDYLVSKVYRQIDRKIRSGEWLNLLQKLDNKKPAELR